MILTGMAVSMAAWVAAAVPGARYAAVAHVKAALYGRSSPPPHAICSGPLSGRQLMIPAGLATFGAVQGQPRLPLRPGEYVLTIDDGPNPATTQGLLGILRANCVPATFMLIGRHATARPDLVRAILAEGQGVGSHSNDHGDFGAMTPDVMHEDILVGVDAVEEAGWGRPRAPTSPRLFRLPGANGLSPVPPASWLAFLAQRHLVLAGYDISPQDWRNDPPEVSFRRLFSGIADRGVIVMHDGQSNTLKLLPMVLAELMRRHAKIVALRLRNGDEA